MQASTEAQAMTKQLLKKTSPQAAPTIEVGDITATVRRSAKRRLLTIRVEGAQVQVRAPTFATLGEIHDFLQLKHAWVQGKVALQQRQLEASRRHWCTGESLPYLGAEIRLSIGYGGTGYSGKSRVFLQRPNAQNEEPQGAILQVLLGMSAAAGTPEQRVQKLVQQWYREQAQEHFAARVSYWQDVTGIRATAQSVRTYKARWGSCNHRAEISFNWKLMMAPPEVIDYVVVHELCHIVHFNHSPDYWALVGRYQPHYNAHRTWLKQHGLSLEL
jgi:predicted metal-dependent hydrolase